MGVKWINFTCESCLFLSHCRLHSLPFEWVYSIRTFYSLHFNFCGDSNTFIKSHIYNTDLNCGESIFLIYKLSNKYSEHDTAPMQIIVGHITFLRRKIEFLYCTLSLYTHLFLHFLLYYYYYSSECKRRKIKKWRTWYKKHIYKYIFVLFAIHWQQSGSFWNELSLLEDDSLC